MQVKISNDYQEARAILSAVSYIKGLDPRTKDNIARTAHAQDYDPDQMVILEGEPNFTSQIVLINQVTPSTKNQAL